MKSDNSDHDDRTNESAGSEKPLSGQCLRKAREENNWTLDFVATQLKIRISQVEAMEAGDWKNICSDTAFAYSYLRNYIQLLGLPVEKTLSQYGSISGKLNKIHSVNSTGSTLNVPRKHWYLPKMWRWLIVVSVILVILWQLFDQWAVSSWFSEINP